MKLLFDQNLSFRLCSALEDIFPESSQVGLLGLSRADDRTVWRRAGQDGYVLVSQDADFVQLATLNGPPPKLVWLRCGNQPTAAIERLLREQAPRLQAFEQDDELTCLEVY